MSQWSQDFKNHGIHITLGELEDFLKGDVGEVSEEFSSALMRINKFLSCLRKSIGRADPDIFPLAELGELDNQLRSSGLYDCLSAYEQSRTLDHLSDANDAIDFTLLPRFDKFLISRFTEESLVSSYDIQDILNSFAKFANEKINDLSEVHNEQQVKVNQLASLAEEIRTKLERIESDTNTRNQQWLLETKTIQDQQSTTFNNWMDKIQSDVSKKHQNILELHGLVAEDAVSAGYLNDGEKEKSQANLWRKISVGFIAITSLWLFASFILAYFSGDGSSTKFWESMVRTFSLSGVLMFGAIYAARQSKSHRDQERRARWYGLEMKALDPYISSLNKNDKNELKKRLAASYFSGHRRLDQSEISSGKGEKINSQIFDALIKIIDKVG